MQELHRKYRPEDWDQVVGQSSVVASLKSVLKKNTSHAFLFVGPSGVGKTTLARILAAKVGADPDNVLELNAAKNNGVDDMRAITDDLLFQAFGQSSIKVVVIDEAHSLSKNAWQSILKPVEEPPDHVYWVFCTTEAGKIPKTIETRCSCFALNPVPVDELIDLLVSISEAEGYETSEEVIGVIARQSFGSPRRAITYLAQCSFCKKKSEALSILSRADEDGDAIILAKTLIAKGLTWQKALEILKPLRDQNPESIRLVTLAYLTSVTMNTKDPKAACRCLSMMEAFSEPYNSSEGFAPLMLSIGQIVFQQD